MAVYDDEKEKTSAPKADGSHDDLGVHPEHREAESDDWGKRFNDSPDSEDKDSSKKASSADDLSAAEESGSSAGPTTAEKKERKQVGGDDEGGLFRNEDEGGGKRKTFLSRFSRRQKVGGGVGAGLLIASIFGIFSVLHGPLQIVHFAQLLQRFHFTNNENFSDSRTGKLYIYLTTRSNPNRRNLGIIMNKPADRYERFLKEAGIEMNFDHPTKNGRQVRRIQSFTIDSNTQQGRNTIESLKKQGVDIPDIGSNGKVIVSARGEGGTKLSRSVIRGSVDSINMNKVSGAIAKRLLIKRAGVDLHPLKNKTYERGQDSADRRRTYNEEVREDAADRDKNGVDAPDRHVSGVQETDKDGNVTNDTNGDAELANGEIDAAKDVKGFGKLQELKLRYAKLIKGAGLAGAAVGVVCAARSLGDQAEEIEYANIVLPLIRIGTRIVATGNQVMTGKDTNVDELGAVSEALYSEDEGSWASARSIQAENEQELTGPDMPDEAKPSQVGEKPILFRILDNGALGAVCGVNNAIGGLPIIKQIGQASDAAIDAALKPFGWSMSKLMTSLASLFAADEVDALAEGATLGNYANYGARLAANDSAISTGGRALSGTETALLDDETDAMLNRQLDQKSLFARYLDLKEPDSLAAKSLFENPDLANPQSAFASLLRNPSTLFSGWAKKLTTMTLAQTNSEYNYGFPEYGYSLDEQDDERLEDPLENAEFIEPRLAELNDRYDGGGEDGPCFGTTVNPDTGALITASSVKYEDANRSDCRNPGQSFPDGTNELIRYRMYLADMVTAHTLACYEGEETSCQQLFGTTSSSGSADASAQTSAPTGDVQSLAQQLLDNPKVTYWTNRGINTRDVVVALAEGKPAYTTCSNAGNETTAVDVNMMKFLVEAGQQTHIMINALTDKCHTANSRHYRGKAVDLDNQSGPLYIISPIANKYGGQKNSETTHHHFDFP